MKGFTRYTWFILIWVFLVILAGGIVRMTQSGMGCPDWPTCFGKWIPPINESQLPADFEKYLGKQDIDHTFNVYHTWIEYINRLLGALLGLWIIPYVVIAIRNFWNSNRKVSFLAIAMLVFTGLIGWTGKVVVDTNLETYQVTIHMLLAIIIAALPLIILSIIDNKKMVFSPALKSMSWVLLIAVLVQIILGTQVRENVDVVSKALDYEQRELWIGQLDNIFLIHRSFSWIIFILVLAMLRLGRKTEHIGYFYGLLGTTCIILLLGIIMNYMGMPAIAQPLHLLTGILFCMQVIWGILHARKKLL